MTGNKQDIINYRFQRAKETLEEAKILAQINHWDTVVNRLYYTCFYAVISLLLENDLLTKSHSGALTLLTNHFVKTGKLDKKYGKFYSKLFSKRQEGDYEDIKRFTQEEIEPLISETAAFIEAIKALIISKL
jgi:uncharacterized protein (UPF0332 family)